MAEISSWCLAGRLTSPPMSFIIMWFPDGVARMIHPSVGIAYADVTSMKMGTAAALAEMVTC